MEFENQAKVVRSNTYTSKTRVTVRPIRRLTPQPERRFLNEPLESYEEFRNHLLYARVKFFKPQGFSIMPPDLISGRLNMLGSNESDDDKMKEKTPPPELYEAIIEKRNKNVRAKLFPFLHKTYQKGVKMIHEMSNMGSKNDNPGEKELIKTNCKCKVERIVEEARVRMGIEKGVKSKINIRPRYCINCALKS